MTLLLLAGTGEAQRIAQALHERNVPTIASLAGVTRAPKNMPVPMRTGGFGGDDGFKNYLQDHEITGVLDATHPFAAQISDRSARICSQANTPYCQLLRPGWQHQTGDLWTMIDSEEAAADHVTPGSTVFLATGRQTLDRFANLAKCRLICRQIDPPDREFPFENGEFLIGRPPFSISEETTTFRDLSVDWLVVKNAGGAASATKLTAARALGIKVAMIKRPPPPLGAKRVETVEEALKWVATL